MFARLQERRKIKIFVINSLSYIISRLIGKRYLDILMARNWRTFEISVNFSRLFYIIPGIFIFSSQKNKAKLFWKREISKNANNIVYKVEVQLIFFYSYFGHDPLYITINIRFVDVGTSIYKAN